jgi:hypothetical protein
VIYALRQIEDDEMGGSCGTYGKEARYIQRFGWEN